MYLTITFANNWAWPLMLIPLFMILYYIFWDKKSNSTVNVSSFFDYKSKSIKTLIRKFLPLFHILAALFIVIAIARPQSDTSKEKSYMKGIDIVMAIDVSTSMLEKDFTPNRMEAAKSVAAEFISKRPNDRIGVVVFAGESYTLCPPTVDHGIVLKQIKSITNGMIDDGTAIGMGLATSVRALKNSNAKSRVCILLTDGVNTAGTIDPNTAIEIAKAFKLKVYTIGVGTPRNNILGIDEPLMRNISKQTGGIYFQAGSNEKLKQIYDEINRLETVEFEKNAMHRKADKFLPFLLGAFGLIFSSVLLKNTILKGIN